MPALKTIKYVGESTLVSNSGTSVTMTAPAGVQVGDVYVAAFLNKNRNANAVSKTTAPTSGDTKIVEAQVADSNDDGDHQYTVFVGVVTTGGAQSYIFNKATDDVKSMYGVVSFFRNVDTANPVDATAVGATSQGFPYADAVGFPAFDPTTESDEIVYIAFYALAATTYSAAMSGDTNPDCTIRFDLENGAGSDGSIALTSGSNDGSSIASRTWASNATVDSASTGVVFALRAAVIIDGGFGGGNQAWGEVPWGAEPVAAAGNPSLSVDAGSYAASGTAASLKRTTKIAPDSGTYTLTGTAASLKKGYKIAAESGTYVVSGTAASLLKTSKIVPDSGVYSITGTAAGLTKGRTIVVDSGTYTITGTAASIKRAAEINPDSGVYSIAGTAAGLNKGRLLAVDSGSYSITGQAAAPKAARLISTNSGSYQITGSTITALAFRLLTATSGVYNISGQTAALRAVRKIPIVSGSYQVSGTLANLLKGRTLSPVSGTYLISGTAANLSAALIKKLMAGSGSYSIIGQDANLIAPRRRRGGGVSRANLAAAWRISNADDEDMILLDL